MNSLEHLALTFSFFGTSFLIGWHIAEYLDRKQKMPKYYIPENCSVRITTLGK